MKNAVERKFNIARRLFPVTEKKKGIIYLNAASTGPLSLPVKEALYKYYEMTQYLEKSAIDREAFGSLDNIRRMGAKLIAAEPDEVGFGFSTTFGLNIAAFGLPLKSGDEILLSDVEFPANVYPWLALRERGIKVKFLKSTNRCFDINIFEDAINKKTKALSLSFVQFFNGYKNDLQAIGEICKKRGLYFIVDGIQGCGAEKIDVRRSHIDIFSSGAQKWMLSPLGTGIFFVRKEIQKKLKFPFASWLAVDWKLNFTDLFHYDLPFFDSARRFEMGTYPYAHVFAMEAALKIILSLGVGNIQRHNRALVDQLLAYLVSDDRYRIVSNMETAHRSSIIAFRCPDAAELHKKLAADKIIASYREGAIRVSPHLYNDASDLSFLIQRLRKYVE
jgi:selenocysteine lyase/cysteine desulfurase